MDRVSGFVGASYVKRGDHEAKGVTAVDPRVEALLMGSAKRIYISTNEEIRLLFPTPLQSQINC